MKVTFDIPKDAADRLRLLAMEGNIRLVDLGIISVETVGQSNAIVVNNPSTKSTSDDHHHSKPMKITPSDSWSGYKMKINGVHYYPSQRYEKNISSSDS